MFGRWGHEKRYEQQREREERERKARYEAIMARFEHIRAEFLNARTIDQETALINQYTENRRLLSPVGEMQQDWWERVGSNVQGCRDALQRYTRAKNTHRAEWR